MKELIKDYLKSDEVIELINKKRIKYNHNITLFVFFKIMIEVLRECNFICSINEPEPVVTIDTVDESNINEFTIYIFKKDEFSIKPLRSRYDIRELSKNLNELNLIQGNYGIGMRESARTLVDIFLDLL